MISSETEAARGMPRYTMRLLRRRDGMSGGGPIRVPSTCGGIALTVRMQSVVCAGVCDAGWVCGDTCRILRLQKTASGWSSGLQMLLVQQLGWLIHGFN